MDQQQFIDRDCDAQAKNLKEIVEMQNIIDALILSHASKILSLIYEEGDQLTDQQQSKTDTVHD